MIPRSVFINKSSSKEEEHLYIYVPTNNDQFIKWSFGLNCYKAKLTV